MAILVSFLKLSDIKSMFGWCCCVDRASFDAFAHCFGDPNLLRCLRVDRPNQVWCADITYLPMQRRFLYFVAVMDWYTRKERASRISNTREA